MIMMALVMKMLDYDTKHMIVGVDCQGSHRPGGSVKEREKKQEKEEQWVI